jgi:hypothetical protein
LNNAAILDLAQSNTPAADIIQQIQSKKTSFNVSKDEIKRLKQGGVPASVIDAMRKAARVPAVPPPAVMPAHVAATPAQPATKTETPPAEIPKPAPPRRSATLVPVAVNDGLPFRIVLAADVPSDAPEGQALSFTAVDGLKVDDNVVIAKGASVTGAITGETGKKKILGIGSGSKRTFRLLEASAVDGKKVNVRCMSGRRADGPTLRIFETVKSSKVKGLSAAQGTEYIAYIDGTQAVSVHKQ